MPTHKSSDYKLSAVEYYLSHSKNQVQPCKIFGCSERSLLRWVDKYKSTINITQKKRDYTSYKITNSHILFIKKQLKQNKTITMDELLAKLKTKYPDLTLSRVHLQIDKVCNKYPEESVKILDGENADWEHGFNSGMLACLRLVSCARIYPENIKEFPFLDT